MENKVYIGWDPREQDAFQVAQRSLLHHVKGAISIHALVLAGLQKSGLYRRPTKRLAGKLIDELSAREDYDGAISTEHANARFFVSYLAKTGWALFMDGDVLVRSDISQLFALADPSKAVMCVKHNHTPTETVKMDGQLQTRYARKNWSSVMLLNCDHPSNVNGLTRELLNTAPGRDMHAFCWLQDREIGALPPEWNWLVGHSDPAIDPKLVHFTDGPPDMPGYEDVPFADEWRRCRLEMIAA